VKQGQCSTCTMTVGMARRVWDTERLEVVRVLEGHNEAVLALAVGDTFLVSGSYDTSVRFWSLDTLRCVRCAFPVSGNRAAQAHMSVLQFLFVTPALVKSWPPTRWHERMGSSFCGKQLEVK